MVADADSQAEHGPFTPLPMSLASPPCEEL
jgi:hypothetical protein